MESRRFRDRLQTWRLNSSRFSQIIQLLNVLRKTNGAVHQPTKMSGLLIIAFCIAAAVWILTVNLWVRVQEDITEKGGKAASKPLNIGPFLDAQKIYAIYRKQGIKPPKFVPMFPWMLLASCFCVAGIVVALINQ